MPEPSGSGPGLRRPVVIVQGETFNRTRIATAVCVILTSNMNWAHSPGNVPLAASLTGLPKDSVANVTQLMAVDKSQLTECVGKLPRAKVALVLAGIDIVLGR